MGNISVSVAWWVLAVVALTDVFRLLDVAVLVCGFVEAGEGISYWRAHASHFSLVKSAS